MARNTAVRVLDDLTGEPAAETVGFGLDGIDYDIDLSFANAEALRGLLQRYADAGRRTGGRKNRPRIVPGAEKTSPKPAAKKAVPAKATPVPTKAEPARVKAAAPKPAQTSAKAEPVKTTRAKKAAEPKTITRATARKVPTVTFSAAE
ncbi:histone-like nucleoid-structuring protein Lsr2 [Amycolatopsis sp. DG1A-15b]|uniref:Lsr2 dimerization domain-containing protein n=1 Tax=Amycolatopsis sp. DG1A-15b TaxID=3052846 RepID=UPI00255B5BD6|nr:histone-like nucleoid-structuring protein Lsr2 [Amycolatopsis sp. DG1A-15b]WIX88832.1 Lsr2 family protein [Amycolatopsis sp. DG1A-15b]